MFLHDHAVAKVLGVSQPPPPQTDEFTVVPAINQGVPKCQIPRRSSCFKKSSDRVGQLRKLPGSNSLFSVGQDSARLYLRYSKKHAQGGTYFGLRETDLRQLVGHNGFICFFFDDTTQPLFVPYADFEEIFHSAAVASDGPYKGSDHLW